MAEFALISSDVKEDVLILLMVLVYVYLSCLMIKRKRERETQDHFYLSFHVFEIFEIFGIQRELHKKYIRSKTPQRSIIYLPTFYKTRGSVLFGIKKKQKSHISQKKDRYHPLRNCPLLF